MPGRRPVGAPTTVGAALIGNTSLMLLKADSLSELTFAAGLRRTNLHIFLKICYTLKCYPFSR